MGGEIIFKACPTTALLHSENPTAPHHRRHHGWVAQSAEQWTENPRVGGSIPPPATPYFSEVKYERKQAFFCSRQNLPEMKENAGFTGHRRHAVSCRNACSRAAFDRQRVLIGRTMIQRIRISQSARWRFRLSLRLSACAHRCSVSLAKLLLSALRSLRQFTPPNGLWPFPSSPR